MKLGLKLVLWLLIPLVGLIVAIGYAYQIQSRALMREELAKEGRAIALVVQMAAEDYLRDGQLADLRQLADRVTGYERVLGMRLFERSGALTYQSSSLDSFPFRNQADLTRVLETGVTAETRRSIHGQPVVGFIVPLQNPRGERLGAVQVLQLESFIDEDAHANRRFIVSLCIAMAAGITVIVLLVTRAKITRPIEGLVRSVREVGAGDVPARVPVGGDDELAGLAREFNLMIERLDVAHASLSVEQQQRRDAETRLRNAARLAGLGRLAAGLAHEIGTPLNVIGGRAEAMMRAAAGDERTVRSLRSISSQIDRITRIVDGMLDFAREKQPHSTTVAVTGVLRQVLEFLGPECKRRKVSVTAAIPATMPTLIADPDQLQQVFLNIGLNALDAMPEGGTLGVSLDRITRAHPAGEGPAVRWMRVAFEDTGTGIAREHLAHVFDPFFTTKEPGLGTGLGLAIAYGIVEEHGGWIDVESTPGRGTRMLVHLPLDAAMVTA